MADITRIFIQGPEGKQQVIKGELTYLPEESVANIYERLSKQPSPYFDFFIFANPNQGVYLVKTPADAFSLTGKSLQDYQVRFAFQNDLVAMHGGLGNGKQVSLEKVIDQEGEVKLSEVVVEVDSEQLLRHEQYLKKKLTDYFKEAIEEKKKEGVAILGLEDFSNLLPPIQYLLESYSYQSAFQFEKKEDGSYRLKIVFSAAPLVLMVEGLDPRILEEAKELLNAKMSEHLKKHPIVKSKNRAAFDEDDMVINHALPQHQANRLVWIYPEGVPGAVNNSLTRKLVTLVEGGDPKWAPILKPYDLMPLSQSVIQEFLVWLASHMEKEKGYYPTTLEPTAQAGVWKLEVKKQPFYNIRIAMEDVVEFKKLGLDLSPEKKELDAGISHWSKKDWKGFLEKLQKKYRAAGYELLVDHPALLTSYDEGKTFWLQAKLVFPLMDRFHIALGGEHLNLIFPLKEKPTKDIFLDQQKLSRKEFDESLKRLSAVVRDKDYLLVSSFPDDLESGMIPVEVDREQSPWQYTLSIQLAKKGKLRLRAKEGLQDSSLRALQTGLGWKEGEPFRPQEFRKKLARICHRLDLKGGEDIEYFYQGDKLDVTLNMERPPSFVGGGLGVDVATGMPMGQAQVALVHRVPQTSQASVQISGGPTAQSLSLNAITLPVSENGTRLVLGLGVERNAPLDNSTSLISVGPQATLLVPLGKGGVSSPWQFHLPVRARYIHRKTPEIEEGQFFVGSGAGVSYLDSSLLMRGDLLSIYLGQDVDGEVHGEAGDTTSKLKGTYRHPLGLGGLQLEWQTHGYHRQNLIGENLSPFRLFPNVAAAVDFAQGSASHLHDSKATIGSLLRKEFGPVTLFGGITWSGTREIDLQGEAAGLHQGLGFGVGAEIFGFPLYFGWTFMEDGNFEKPGAFPNSFGFYFNPMGP